MNDTGYDVFYRIISSPYAINVTNTILFVISIILLIAGVIGVILSVVGFFPGIGTVASVIGFIIGLITTIISIATMIASLVILIIDWTNAKDFILISNNMSKDFSGSLSLPVAIEVQQLKLINGKYQNCIYQLDKISTPPQAGDKNTIRLLSMMNENKGDCVIHLNQILEVGDLETLNLESIA